MRVARGVLAMVLPLSYLLGVTPAVFLLTAGNVGTYVGPTTVASGVLGVGLGALVAPRLLPVARGYAFTRRFFAGICGVVAAIALSRGLEGVGVNPDALSDLGQSSTALEQLLATAQEAVSLLAFFGALGVVPYLILGAPRAASQGNVPLAVENGQ